MTHVKTACGYPLNVCESAWLLPGILHKEIFILTQFIHSYCLYVREVLQGILESTSSTEGFGKVLQLDN